MAETPLSIRTTLAFGAAGTYAERANNANSYAPIEGQRIHQVEIAASPDRVIRADELLIQHPLAIQELARAYLDTLVIVAFPEMIEDMRIEEHFPDGRVVSSENPQFFLDLLESATGDHLARAIHAKFHGFGVGEREHLTFAGDLTDGPGIIDCQKVRGALLPPGSRRFAMSTAQATVIASRAISGKCWIRRLSRGQQRHISRSTLPTIHRRRPGRPPTS